MLSQGFPRYFARDWIILLVFGLLAFAIADRLLIESRNLYLIAPVLLLGAFIVPTVFTLFIADHFRRDAITVYTLMVVFAAGGVLGLLIAGMIELQTLQSSSNLAFVGISVVEELAKLVVPIMVFMIGKYRSTAAGVMVGVASAMGFASLESMSYATVALVRSYGDIGVIDDLLLSRSLFATGGHSAWTGLICAALWRNRNRGRPWYHHSLIAAFGIAVMLHTIWNIFADEYFTVFGLGIVSALVAVTGFVLLMVQVKRSAVDSETSTR